MGRALAAALSGSVSVVAAGAVIGVALLTSTPGPVAATSGTTAGTSPAISSPAASGSAEARATDRPTARAIAKSLSLALAALERYANAPNGGPHTSVVDTAAMRAGLRGPHTFTATVTGLTDLGTLGSTINGSVTDATHFTLEFPESSTVTKYVRDDAVAWAWVGGQRLTLAAGAGAVFGTMSPEDLLPETLWAMAVDPWSDTLAPDTGVGDYAARSTTLTAEARAAGYGARDWTLRLHVDAEGRATALTFAGSSFGVPFDLDISVAYR